MSLHLLQTNSTATAQGLQETAASSPYLNLAYVLLIVTFLVCLFVSPPFRMRLASTFFKVETTEKKSLRKRFAGRYVDWFGGLVILRGVLIFLLPLAAEPFVDEYWSPKFSYDPFILGFTLIVFIWFQWPHMLRPDFIVTTLPTSGKNYQEPRGDQALHVVEGEVKLAMFRITNLGTHTYTGCSVWFYFPSDFELFPNEETSRLYEGVDFVKKFEVQRGNHGFVFTPSGNYLTMAPLDHLLFSMMVKVPFKPASKQNEVRVELRSETNLGTKTQRVEIVFDKPD